MQITPTKNGYLGQVKGCINGIPFCFYFNGDTAKTVHQNLIFEVAKLCAYARLAAQEFVMSQQQALPYVPKHRGTEAQKQRDEQIKKHIAQTEKDLGGK